VGTNRATLVAVSIEIDDGAGVVIKAAGDVEIQPVRIRIKLTRKAKRLNVCNIIFNPLSVEE